MVSLVRPDVAAGRAQPKWVAQWLDRGEGMRARGRKAERAEALEDVENVRRGG